MSVPEVLDSFEDYIREENIPFRFIDLRNMCLVGIETIRNAFLPAIESIGEADIERHTSYANQRREDVIRMMIQGVVKYATLSHTWSRSGGVSEFRYQDMISGRPRTGPAWDKLERFCDLARRLFRCRFAWTDIVCVDYSNPSDQQSAAQSLFKWYRNAYVCIAYLASASGPSDMRGNEWFMRGFTLTELLAPMKMKFYGARWKALNNDYIDNDKADDRFLGLLSEASGIPVDDLRTFWPGPERVRQKLSWASNRETTAIEDKAYSLMPIFDSRIDVMYGEGEKAFVRLMMDIIPRSGECDVFAWAGLCSKHHPAIPPSAVGFGEQHSDRQLGSTPHHYRLCGDRSLSINPDHLCIRVFVVEVTLPRMGFASYRPAPLRHRASISEVTLLYSQDLASLYAGGDAQMAVGVVDYGWTGSPDEGMLESLRDGDYFCFLMYKCSKTEGSWRKLLTEKVVFLTSTEKLVQKLDTVHILHQVDYV